MLPIVSEPKSADRAVCDYLVAIVEAGFSGECESGFGHRLAQSTDNSIYQIIPDAVVFPRSMEDLKILSRIASHRDFPSVVLRPRGGGTGTNGQSLGKGVIVDLSRHMNRILSIDPERRVAVVQAGVVKDQLQAALKPFGLFFPPELSTSNRATIGGMISTDASGQGSVLYGKTRHHVRSVTLVLPDGNLFVSGASESADGPARETADEIVQALDRLEHEVGGRWRDRVPQLNRNVTGYDIGHLRGENGSINTNSVICGSEGTLGFIATAELDLTPIPRHAGVVVVVYADFVAMLRETVDLMGFGAASIEVIDQRLLLLAKGDTASVPIMKFFQSMDKDASVDGACMVEFVGDDLAEIMGKMSALEQHLNGARRHLSLSHTTSAADIAAIWGMRKRAVGLLANVTGGAVPVAFVEDTAVPPAVLADYIAEFRQLLAGYGLEFGMFGHADAGVLHVRPDLDLTKPEHRALVRQITDAVFALTQKYGGVLWGEHGKGVRSAYSERFFGDLYPAIQSVKALFDPREQFNPGKIASATNALPTVDAPTTRGEREAGLVGKLENGYDRAFNCNGNGACFDFDLDTPMCPSWKATRDRRFSPKGRATLTREWLRQLDLAGVDVGAKQASGWRTLPKRLVATLRREPDFSHEVKTVFDGCLGCKACTGSCPVKVNVPGFKARFLALYHTRYLRSLSDRLIAHIEMLLPLLAPFSPVYNLMTQTPPGKTAMRWMGLAALPHMPRQSLRSGLRARGVSYADPVRMARLSSEERAENIVLVADEFLATFEPSVVLDAVDLIQRLGLRCSLAQVRNGKPLHAKGLLDRFALTAGRTAEKLEVLAATGATLVGIDPAMTLVYRDEYAQAIGRKLPVLLLEEWLAGQRERIAERAAGRSGTARLANHCSAQTNLSRSSELWQRVFEIAGIALTSERTGCCGMAGTFGHEVSNRKISRQIYALSWKARVEGQSEGAELVAPGFSCRCQAREESSATLRHPVSLLLELLTTDRS